MDLRDLEPVVAVHREVLHYACRCRYRGDDLVGTVSLGTLYYQFRSRDSYLSFKPPDESRGLASGAGDPPFVVRRGGLAV